MTRKVIKLDPLSSYSERNMSNMNRKESKEQQIPSISATRAVPDWKSPADVQAATPLFFHLEQEEASPSDPIEHSILKHIEGYTTPQSIEELSLHRNVKYAYARSNGCIYELANSLERYGYPVSIAKSQATSGTTPASFYALHHQFIVISLNGEDIAIDASIKDHFLVNNATERLQSVLDNLPDILIAPFPRFLKAITLISLELTRCFSIQGLDLPPWRRLRSTLSKWKDVTLVENSAAQPVKGRKQALMHDVYKSKSQLRIAEKLLRMGLPSADILQYDDDDNKSNSASLKQQQKMDKSLLFDTSEGGGGGVGVKGGSPASVLESLSSSGASTPRHVPHKVYYGFHIATESNECLCCGLRRRYMRYLNSTQEASSSSMPLLLSSRRIAAAA